MNARRSLALALVAMLTLLVLAPAAASAAARWELLGTRTVTDRIDHDTIAVTAKEGKFTALQLRVRGVAVQFRSMTVHFGNGEKQEVELVPVSGKLEASGSFKVSPGTKVVATVSKAGKSVASIRFTLK